MTISRILPALMLAWAGAGFGQTPRLVPDIAVAEGEFRDAQEAWLQADPNLARDLFKANPAEMRTRIQRVAALRDTLMLKQAAYLDLLIQRLRQTQSRLAQSPSPSIPAAELKKDLAAEQSRVLGEQEGIEALVRDLPQGDEYFLVRHSLEEERAMLVNLQNNIAMRSRSLDNIGKAQEAIQQASVDPLSGNLDAILKIWEEEQSSVVRERGSWANLYGAMERSLDKAAGPGTAPSVSPGSSKSGAPAGKQPRQRAAAPAAPGSGPRAGFAGTWKYESQPGAWAGYGEPEMATLELREEGNVLRGSYTARLPVRGAVHQMKLTLEGARLPDGSARLRWTSLDPAAEGEIEIKLGSDGRLFLERTRSNDSFVPRGMEVLLPR